MEISIDRIQILIKINYISDISIKRPRMNSHLDYDNYVNHDLKEVSLNLINFFAFWKDIAHTRK